jgi:hypothetical protein
MSIGDAQVGRLYKGYPNDVERPNLIVPLGELNMKQGLDDVETPNLGVSTQSQ